MKFNEYAGLTKDELNIKLFALLANRGYVKERKEREEELRFELALGERGMQDDPPPTLVDVHRTMIDAWGKMQDSLGGPVDAEDAKQMRLLLDYFTQAANDYCSMVWDAEHPLDTPPLGG